MLSLSTFMPLGPLAALSAFIAMFLLSQLWLSPLMFGRAWVRHSGIRPSDLRPADVKRIMLTAFISRAVWALLFGVMTSHVILDMDVTMEQHGRSLLGLEPTSTLV